MPGSKPLKVLLVAPQPFFQERGTPIAVRLLSESLAADGYQVHLLVYHEGEDIELQGVNIHRSQNLPFIRNIRPGMSLKKVFCDVFMLMKMVGLNRHHQFDVVHAVEESVFLAQLLKPFSKTPYIFDMDSCMSEQITDKHPGIKFMSSFMESFEKRAVRGSIGVIAVCRALEEMALGYSPDTPILRLEDISMVDDDIDGEESLRERYGVTGVLMLYVGNLESYQGIDLLLEAFSRVQDSTGDARLLVIGGIPEDIEQYQQLSERLGIDGRVVFCGSRPMNQLGFYLAQADILLSPRTQGNNTPMKIYSYLGSGKAVLATRLPTHTQVLTDEVACLVEAEPAAMAEGIERLCLDAALRQKLGSEGKALVAREYSLKAFREKLSVFYKQISDLINKNQ